MMKKRYFLLDTDECASGRACTNILNAKCENRQGGYACVCKQGYERTAEGCRGTRDVFFLYCSFMITKVENVRLGS